MIAVPLAGCVGVAESGAPKEAGDDPKVSSGPAEFDENTGALAGIVTDSELAPIAEAQVGLPKSDLIPEDIVVLTDTAGRFTMSNVPPGDHDLFVQALGYQSKASKVGVVAGAVTDVNVALERLPSDEPYHLVDIRKAAVTAVMYKASPQCLYFSSYVPPGTPVSGYATLLKTCGGARFGCDPSANCEVHYVDQASRESDVKTIHAEAAWTPQTGVTGFSRHP